MVQEIDGRRRHVPTAWVRDIDDWLAWLRLRGLSGETVAFRGSQIRRVARGFPGGPGVVCGGDLGRWLSVRGWSADTLRSHVSAVRGFFRWWCQVSGSADPTVGLPDVRRGVHVPRPAPREVIVDGLSVADSRVGLMVRLACGVGLRRGEIARLRVDDVWESCDGWSLVVRGKGGRERVIPLPVDLAGLLRASGEGWVFPSPGGGHLTAGHVGKLIARVLPGHWTAHPLRHRFATDLYVATRDIVVVQRFLGHSRPETTLAYVQVPEDALREGLMLLSSAV